MCLHVPLIKVDDEIKQIKKQCTKHFLNELIHYRIKDKTQS